LLGRRNLRFQLKPPKETFSAPKIVPKAKIFQAIIGWNLTLSNNNNLLLLNNDTRRCGLVWFGLVCLVAYFPSLPLPKHRFTVPTNLTTQSGMDSASEQFRGWFVGIVSHCQEAGKDDDFV
jgi:hypothetical protein